MKYILWDIDGTLLLTNRAGIAALREAIRLRYGKDDFDFTHGMAGRTDSFIIKQSITDIKGRCTAADAANLAITYNMLLPRFLRERKGHVLPNVVSTLDFLAQHPDKYTNVLLTGNFSEAAHAKVTHYGLEQFFNYRLSSFGEISEDRNMLAQAALEKLYLADNTINPATDVLVIGDTPHDIACAAAIKARCLAILSGSFYDAAELEAAHPYAVLPELPAKPAEFVKYLEE